MMSLFNTHDGYVLLSGVMCQYMLNVLQIFVAEQHDYFVLDILGSYLLGVSKVPISRLCIVLSFINPKLGPSSAQGQWCKLARCT